MYGRDSGQYRALKIGKSEEKFTTMFKEEGEILEELMKTSQGESWMNYISQLKQQHEVAEYHQYPMKFYGCFPHNGPNECILA